MEVSGKAKNGGIREDKAWKYQGRQRMEGRQRMDVSGKTKNGSIRRKIKHGSIRGDKEWKYYEDEEWKY